MKKGLLLILSLMLVASFGFAGGAPESQSAALENVDPSGVTITYWYQHTRGREEAIQALIQDFNANNEWGITVEGEYAGGYSDIYNKMITGIAGGSVPDLVVAYQNQAAGYQLSDALVDLNPYVDSPKWGLGSEKADFFKGFINQDVNAQFGGQRLGFPTNRSMELMYYNQTWLEELGYSAPPKTWDEFYAMCKAATEKGDGEQYGYALRTDASNVFSLIIAGGGQLEKAGGGYNYNNPQLKEAFTFMKKLYDDGYARKIAEAYGEQTDFGNYKVLFTMGSSSGLPYYASAVEGSERPFEWGVAPIPYSTPKPAVNIYGASLSVPKTTPEKQLAAWLFIKYLASVDAQAEWTRASNYFPVRSSVANNLSDYFAQNPQFEQAFRLLQTGDTFAEPPYAGYDEVRDLANSAFNAVLDGADIDQVLADLDKDANEVYEDVSP